MDFTVFLSALWIAFAFTQWTLMGKYMGVQGAWLSVLVSSATLLVGLAAFVRAYSADYRPSASALCVVVASGFLNGFAVYRFSMNATDATIPTGLFMATVFVLMVVLAPLIDAVAHGGALGARQLTGLALAALAIWLING